MESISTSKELYKYIQNKLKTDLSQTQELSLLFKATQKSFDGDAYMLVLWLNYTQILKASNAENIEISETFRTLQMRFYKFYGYWREYIGFEASINSKNLPKILKKGLEYLQYREFNGKRCIVGYLYGALKLVNSGRDIDLLIYNKKGKYFDICNIYDLPDGFNKILNICRGALQLGNGDALGAKRLQVDSLIVCDCIFDDIANWIRSGKLREECLDCCKVLVKKDAVSRSIDASSGRNQSGGICSEVAEDNLAAQNNGLNILETPESVYKATNPNPHDAVGIQKRALDNSEKNDFDRNQSQVTNNSKDCVTSYNYRDKVKFLDKSEKRSEQNLFDKGSRKKLDSKFGYSFLSDENSFNKSNYDAGNYFAFNNSINDKLNTKKDCSSKTFRTDNQAECGANQDKKAEVRSFCDSNAHNLHVNSLNDKNTSAQASSRNIITKNLDASNSLKDKLGSSFDDKQKSDDKILPKERSGLKFYNFKSPIKMDDKKVIRCKLQPNFTLTSETEDFNNILKFPKTDVAKENKTNVAKPSMGEEVRNGSSIKNRQTGPSFETEKLQKDAFRKNLSKFSSRPVKEEFFIVGNRRCRKIKLLGRGGSSKVYQVLCGTEIYALKVINVSDDKKMLDLIHEEIDLLTSLHEQESIIDIIGYDIKGDHVYILLECGETDLSRFIKTNNLTINMIRYIWEQILEIVDNIHKKRIIHGDLKPANFVFVKGHLKLIDFGVSKVLRGDTTRLDLETAFGTINYSAPEVLYYNGRNRRRSLDVWSLGCILYEMVYSAPPLNQCKDIMERLSKLQSINEHIVYDDQYEVINSVIKECLVVEANKRSTVDKLLEHPFLRREYDD